MGNAGVKYKEIRFVIGDCPMGVQGWHHKTFPGSKSVLDIMQMWEKSEVEEPMMWAQEAPK